MSKILTTFKTYPFEHFYELMPEPYKSELVMEARTEVKEFETPADFLLFGFIWCKLPNDSQYWFEFHDKMPYILPKEIWRK